MTADNLPVQGDFFMQRVSTLLLLVLGLCLPMSLFAADWAHFLGPNSNCSSPETGINKSWNTTPPATTLENRYDR